MHTATLNAKCQLVLPALLRRQHGFKPRARVVLENRPEGLLVRPAAGAEPPEHVPEFNGPYVFSEEEYHLHNTFGETFGVPAAPAKKSPRRR